MTRTLLPSLLLALVASEAHALKLDVKKKYEQELIRWALAQTGLEREPSPQGKIIERIEIVREDIIAKSDPWPNFLNWFHVKTRDYIVRQEILVAKGELWNDDKVAESARNLRKLFILAVVRTAACKSKKPGHVVLLVVTKDLWSIRLNTIFSQVGTVLTKMEFTPTEQNFLGRNKRLSLHVRVEQWDWETRSVRDQFAVGQLYIDPRVLGTRLRLVEWFDLVLAGDVPCGGAWGSDQDVWCPERGTGAVEGAYAQLRLTRPLFSLDTTWGFDSWAVVDIRQVRRYRFNSGGTVPRGEHEGLSLRTDQLPGHYQSPAVPRVYDVRQVAGSASYTRSFGSAKRTKNNLTSGVTVYSYRYTHPDGLPFSDDVLRWHAATFLPRGEDAALLFVAGRSFSPRYIRLHNIQGFALSEDFALGHEAGVELQVGMNMGEIAHSYAAGIAKLAYRWYLRDDLLTVWLYASGRMQPGLREIYGDTDAQYDGPWTNTSLELGARNVSPAFWYGRLHTRIQAVFQRAFDPDAVAGSPRTLYPARVYLGGDSGLRGYPSDQFEGENLMQVNVEYRSKPLNLFTLHLGFVVFYDGGGVFGGPDPRQRDQDLAFRYHHSVGVGIRGHFPQFDKESLRADFAIPLTDAAGSPSTWFSLSFMQVF